VVLLRKLLDLFFLFRKESRHIRQTFHMVLSAVLGDERELLFFAEHPLVFLSSKNPFAVIYLPLAMVKTDAIGASVAKQVRVACAVL
jgi:hypothetical protein